MLYIECHSPSAAVIVTDYIYMTGFLLTDKAVLRRVALHASAVLAVANPSVRLSLCLSVRHTLSLCHAVLNSR